MNILTKKLYQHFLPKLIKNKCDERIPRSGTTGKRTNCFLVSLDKHNNQSLLVEAFFEDTLNCIEWDKTAVNNNVLVNLDDIDDNTLVVDHFYGLYQVKYLGIYDYLLG